MAANLHAGVQTFVRLDLQFQNEIAVFLFGAEKRVAAALDGHGPDDDAILDGVSRLAAAHDPAVEIGAVANGLEFLGAQQRGIAAEQGGGRTKPDVSKPRAGAGR